MACFTHTARQFRVHGHQVVASLRRSTPRSLTVSATAQAAASESPVKMVGICGSLRYDERDMPQVYHTC
jgi:hypothetical protein